MKTIRNTYEHDYLVHTDICCADTKWEWAASRIFDLTTYDGCLDEIFVKKIIEVCKVILRRETYQYIQDEHHYLTYILVCNLLRKFRWITWGTSIRGAWFNYVPGAKPIIEYPYENSHNPIPFTESNLKAFIMFMEEKE